MMLEFRRGTGSCDFADGLGTTQGGFDVLALLEDSEAWSLFHKLERVAPDPFLKALRKEPFFSEGFICGRSSFDFFVGGDFVIDIFLGAGLSEPLMDEAELIGFLDLF
jgi:hypothetical protein